MTGMALPSPRRMATGRLCCRRALSDTAGLLFLDQAAGATEAGVVPDCQHPWGQIRESRQASGGRCRLRLLAAGARQCRFRRRRRDMSAPQARNWPVRLALRSAAFAERWFPDAYVVALLGVVVVAACPRGLAAPPSSAAARVGA